MLLKKIKLENIRSYISEEISFPDGSVLLSGNIGSGKSSILLAIDFVLFGLSSGLGNALLRNGEENGSVELHFKLDDKDVVIKRSLKRKNKSVTQDYGYLIINNEKIEGSATELKARILELLNYPKELLTKSKDLIYKYTVYTPQENMKAILIGDKDSRLETLRKVFGIDKYKRIVNNSEIFLKGLRNKVKEFEIRVEKMDEKNNKKKEKEIELDKLKEEIEKIVNESNKIADDIKANKKTIESIEKDIKEKNKLRNEININEINIKNYKSLIERENLEINNLKTEINELENELKNKKEENIDELIEERIKINENIINLEQDMRDLRDKIVELSSKKEASNGLKKQISELNNCPTCLQDVNDEHKRNIINKEDNKIKNILEEIKNINVNEIENNLKINKNKLEEINNKISEVNVLKIKFKTLKEKRDKLEILNKNIVELNDKLNEINKKFNELSKQVSDFESLEDKYYSLREEFDELINKDKLIEIRRVTLQENKNEILNNIKELDEEILFMRNVEKNLEYFRQLEKWLEEVFINMMNIMEKKIMLKAYTDFNELFEKWFNILVENELINVKLDDEFSPVIILNGYETDYAHLSGGERTAAALSYRLALNQVINNLMSEIKTKDLIILDEPTEGFSSEQLDRVKLVLQELNLKQIIIVSHEPKVESFVDNILRFEKKEHVSKLI